MSKIQVGIDIVEIQRIGYASLRWQNSFLKRVYTEAELKNCHGVASRLAARFAAKEAVMKALGSGSKGLKLKEIEVLSDTGGAPLLQLYGGARTRAAEMGISEFSVSMSHSEQYAVAFVIGNVV